MDLEINIHSLLLLWKWKLKWSIRNSLFFIVKCHQKKKGAYGISLWIYWIQGIVQPVVIQGCCWEADTAKSMKQFRKPNPGILTDFKCCRSKRNVAKSKEEIVWKRFQKEMPLKSSQMYTAVRQNSEGGEGQSSSFWALFLSMCPQKSCTEI